MKRLVFAVGVAVGVLALGSAASDAGAGGFLRHALRAGLLPDLVE